MADTEWPVQRSQTVSSTFNLTCAAMLCTVVAACGGSDDASDGPADVTVEVDATLPADGGTEPDLALEPDAAPACPPTCPVGTRCVEGACVDGCDDAEDCDQGQICHEGHCVGCRNDQDCIDGYICLGIECEPGCRDDDTCPDGQICTGQDCVDGCRADPDCAADEICEEQTCQAGCRDDAACGEGAICQAQACVDGCRDDAGCPPDRLCIDATCELRGLRCRVDADCEAGTCVDGFCRDDGLECTDDAEPNDAWMMATLLAAGQRDGLRVCAGDVDVFRIALAPGERLQVEVLFGPAPAQLDVALRRGEAEPVVAQGEAFDGGLRLAHTAEGGDYSLRVQGATPETVQNYVLQVEIREPAPMCVDTPVFADGDGDGYGDGAPEVQCVEGGTPPDGFSLVDGDCGPDDAWRNPDAGEICDDNVDDDCDGADLDCPETQPGIRVPMWDCVGEPLPRVYAWARFADGQGYFQDGGCFVFFEGRPGEFYVKRQLFRANQDPACERRNGCTCPSLKGWPAYDRRMYAFTTIAAADACPDVSIVDHAGEEQIVSNACRKYLYQLHFYDIPYSFLTHDRAELDRRLALFPTVEVACAEDAPHRNLPFQQLLVAPIQLNPGFEPMEDQ